MKLNDRISIFLQYKYFYENILSSSPRQERFVNVLCEIAELEFLSRLPRNSSKDAIKNFILGLNKKFKTSYDAPYLAARWEKIFHEKEYSNLSEAQLVIFERDERKCQYCGRDLDMPEIHHVIPRDLKKFAGPFSKYNLVLICGQCNKEILNSIVLPINWWLLHPESKNKAKK